MNFLPWDSAQVFGDCCMCHYRSGCSIYTMEYYSAIKKQYIYEILRKMDRSRKYRPEWGNLITKNHTWYALNDKWILSPRSGIPKIQFTDHMKLKEKENQSVDASLLLRRGNKILTWGNMEPKCGAETEGKAIQRLSHLGLHPVCIQSSNSDTVVDAKKCLLTEA